MSAHNTGHRGEDAGTVLTLDDITARSGQRWTHDPQHGQEMFDVRVLGVERVVVPTRMHEPGWYIRTRDGSGVYENERDPAVLRQWCDDGIVTDDSGSSGASHIGSTPGAEVDGG